MKKLILITLAIFLIGGCEKEKQSGLFTDGKIEGHTYFETRDNPIKGLNISLHSKGIKQTDEEGYFFFTGLKEGEEYTLEVFDSEWESITHRDILIEEKITNVEFFFTNKYKELPEILVIDLVNESDNWDYFLMGAENYAYIKEKNSKPEKVLFYSQEESLSLFFNEDGLPEKLLSGDYIFLFDNFNANKFDFAVICPSGEIETFREVESDINWGELSSLKSTEKWIDILRWAGKCLDALPCAISITATIASGLAALPSALFTCGNYFAKGLQEIYEEQGIENGFTKAMDIYGKVSPVIDCITGDEVDCLESALEIAEDKLFEELEEIEERENEINYVEDLLENPISELKTIAIQPGPKGKDACIHLVRWYDCSEDYPHYGNDSLLEIFVDESHSSCTWYEKKILISFEDYLPKLSNISSAKFEFYGTFTSNFANTKPKFAIKKLESPWEESTVDWTNQPGGNTINHFEAEGECFNSIDVTSAIKEWNEGEPNYGFSIIGAAQGVRGWIISGDHSDKEKRPKLIINYFEN